MDKRYGVSLKGLTWSQAQRECEIVNEFNKSYFRKHRKKTQKLYLPYARHYVCQSYARFDMKDVTSHANHWNVILRDGWIACVNTCLDVKSNEIRLSCPLINECFYNNHKCTRHCLNSKLTHTICLGLRNINYGQSYRYIEIKFHKLLDNDKVVKYYEIICYSRKCVNTIEKIAEIYNIFSNDMTERIIAEKFHMMISKEFKILCSQKFREFKYLKRLNNGFGTDSILNIANFSYSDDDSDNDEN